MREIVLDTETTGFEPSEGHRIVEIGALELFNHLPTGRTYHQYINPERGMPAGAFEVHGIGHDILETPGKPVPGGVTLRDKPVFARIGQAFLAIDPDALAGREVFLDRVETLVAAMLADEGVRLPGDRRRANRERIAKEGIALAPELAAKIRALAGEG